MRKSILVAAVLLLAPATGQAKTLDELLVEKGVITKGEAAGATSGGLGKVSYRNGSRFEYPSEGITTTIATQLQERYTYTDNDEDSGLSNTSSFSTKRARIIVSGSALHEEFTYVLQTDFVGDTDEDGAQSPELRDAYIQWKACDWAAVRMGQFKTAISRQFNTNSAKLQFADRSLASEFFDLDRQQGLAASADLADGMIKVGAGIFNGSSDGEGINRPGVDTKHTGVVSVRANVMGKMDVYEEGDIEWTEDTAVSLGAAYAHESANSDLGAGLEDTDTDTVSVDANLKTAGLSVHAEYFFATADADSFADEVEPTGFYAQVGYFLDPKTLEIAARYSFLDCDDGLAGGVCDGNDNVNEAAFGVNYYFWKHNLKAQLNYVFQNEDETGADGDDFNTNKWIFQISAYL